MRLKIAGLLARLSFAHARDIRWGFWIMNTKLTQLCKILGDIASQAYGLGGDARPLSSAATGQCWPW